MRKHVSVGSSLSFPTSSYPDLILFSVSEFVAFEVVLVFGSEDELEFMYILESVGNEGSP